MYVMTDNLVPGLRVRHSAFTNQSGPSGLVDAKIAGIGYIPGRPLELIVARDEYRFYDVPLRFTGAHGGQQYGTVESRERPHFTHEPRPRRATAMALPWAASETGWVHGALTWDLGNVTFLLVTLDSGEAIFWPPHKIVWSDEARPFPAWTKRRYADDEPVLARTAVVEATDEEMTQMTAIAVSALTGGASSWRSHGIGLIQRYMPGPKGPEQYRVHVWTPGAVQIGLESGIHNHRYDLRSTIVCGVLTQEEWTPKANATGLWHEWRHDNESKEPKATGLRFDLSPRTLDIRCGQAYTFPRDGLHRSLPRSEVVISVMERFGVEGYSCAYCPTGVVPVNGQTVKLNVAAVVKLAKKNIGVHGK